MGAIKGQESVAQGAVMETEEGASTLLPPPPRDPSKAPIENTLEVTEMRVLGQVRDRAGFLS